VPLGVSLFLMYYQLRISVGLCLHVLGTLIKMSYTSEEYTDMIICYGMAEENAEAVFMRSDFPIANGAPSPKAIRKCVLRAKETGYLLPNKRNRSGAPIRRNIDDEEEVLREFEENPGTSVRRAAHAFGLSRTTVHLILRQNGLRPFHYQRVQQLLEQDAAPRIQFCEGIRIFFLFDNHGAFLRKLNINKTRAEFLAQCRRNASFPDRYFVDG